MFLGLKLEPDKNANTPGDIDVAADGSAIPVLVVHTQGEWQIALECFWLAECRL
jgi:acetate kinase